jgi:hypothetical protein
MKGKANKRANVRADLSTFVGQSELQACLIQAIEIKVVGGSNPGLNN